MVSVITSDNQTLYGDALETMHRDRKTIFIDTMKWDLPCPDGVHEVDQFDTADAVYLLAADPRTRAHLGSVRLLPTTRPHLLGSVFPQLCDTDLPVGPDVWEITRLCTAPQLDPQAALQVRSHLTLAVVEFALLYGVSQYTAVTYLGMVPGLLAVGWDCDPLGLPKDCGGDMLTALSIRVTPATLQMLRTRMERRAPVLEIQSAAWAA
jgi:N-acyl-L-homoserine lactone synthetase